jgi:hypothetical protein
MKLLDASVVKKRQPVSFFLGALILIPPQALHKPGTANNGGAAGPSSSPIPTADLLAFLWKYSVIPNYSTIIPLFHFYSRAKNYSKTPPNGM